MFSLHPWHFPHYSTGIAAEERRKPRFLPSKAVDERTHGEAVVPISMRHVVHGDKSGVHSTDRQEEVPS